MLRDFKEYTIMDAKGTTGIGNVIYCDDFRHAVISVTSASSANGTLKFAGSIAEVAPDFAATASPTNAWDFVQVSDLEDNSAIDGDTGLVLSGTDDSRLFEVNTNGLRYLTANITAIAAGSFTVKVRLYNN